MAIYDIHHFIVKFSAIPEDRWIVGSYRDVDAQGDKCCALGHCGMRDDGEMTICEAPEASALEDLVSAASHSKNVSVVYISDGKDKRYPQPTPKQRVLALLSDIKAGTVPCIL